MVINVCFQGNQKTRKHFETTRIFSLAEETATNEEVHSINVVGSVHSER